MGQKVHIKERKGVMQRSRYEIVLCLISLFKKYGFAIKPFSLLRDHFRGVSFVPLNPARSASVQAVRRNRSATTRA
jgi:hypothetical protein